MENLIVNLVKSQLKNRPLFQLSKTFGTSQSLSQGRCSGGACDCGKKKKKEDKTKCAPPPPPPPPKKDDRTKVAVVLTGCGHLDGSCVYESTAVAISLYRNGIQPVFYAPKNMQDEVVNHITGNATAEERVCIREGARISRGCIQELCHLKHCDAGAVIFPGGLGVTKTLTTFETERINCSIDAEVLRIMEEFHDARKPMGFISIAGILPARLFPFVKVTFGMKGKQELWPHQYLFECACAMGADVEFREVDGHSFDKQHMVFSTPGFLFNGTSAQIFDGIGTTLSSMCKYIE